jgi:exodeoxyribonuclease VII large subunit
MVDAQVLSVGELTLRLKTLLEAGFPQVNVRGEISNLSRASSGHVYFTLKDESAQIRAVLWRSAAMRIQFEIHDGLHVVAAGPIELYPARGSYQIVVEQLSPEGIGPLELAFRQLYERLGAEGLFRAERKRPLPRFPRRIALVTSPAGAAVRDMLQVITRRWPACEIVILPVAVQGPTAAGEIADALRAVARLSRIDVVITGRGGGSLEDLWAFNEEIVARAIFHCPIPVVSAVGHEIDVTIADLIADRRALTPSEAGEIVVPQQTEILSELVHFGSRLEKAMRDRLRRYRMNVDALAASRALTRPRERVEAHQRQLGELAQRLRRGVRQRFDLCRRDVDKLAGTIDALSPLKVLGRGYSLTRRGLTGQILRGAEEIEIGEQIETILSRGRLTSIVESAIVSENGRYIAPGNPSE